MKVFHSLDTMDWTRVFQIVLAAGAMWSGLVSLVPEQYHKKGTVVLGSVLAGVTVMMRSGKSRVAKVEDKVEEIHELIINEAKDKAEQMEAK